ncbi:MAG: PAS domain S-box protein [Methanotrichaceae archaeon]|nr:PAS domain S-box protein [Methanotrichaceae archaeon]
MERSVKPYFESWRSWSSKKKAALVLAAVFAYMIAFLPIYSSIGDAAGAIYMLPVVIAGWLFGVRGGLLLGLLSIPVNVLHYSQILEIRLIHFLPLWPGNFTAIVVGSVTGWLRQLLDQMRDQADELKREEGTHQAQISKRKLLEEQLRKSYEGLELKIKERTAELKSANASLQKEIAERKMAEERLARLNKTFLNFGTDPSENITALTALCKEQLNGTFAIYSQLENERLTMAEQWNVPSDIVPVKRPDGQMCYNLKNQNDEDRKYMEIISSAISVEEEKKHALRMMQESEARFRRLAENAPDIIARLTILPKPQMNYISPAVERILGYAPEEFYIRPELGRDIIHPDDFHLFVSVMKGEIPSGDPITLRLLRKDGKCIWAEQRSVPIYDESGEIVAIECITRDVTDRIYTEEQLKSSLEEKEVLLKEVHHRVKNNMQVISSLLNLQSDSIKDPRIIEILKESRNRVRSMAVIHEKLYKSADFKHIDFGEYIRNLAADLLKSYRSMPGGIQLRINVEDAILGIDTAIPCGLIINELVSNALKHAFPEDRKGEINIELFRNGDRFTLIVSDNGIGFPEGLDFRQTESLGLQLVRTLTQQLGGTIELYRNCGTVFKIIFSESERNR